MTQNYIQKQHELKFLVRQAAKHFKNQPIINLN